MTLLTVKTCQYYLLNPIFWQFLRTTDTENSFSYHAKSAPLE